MRLFDYLLQVRMARTDYEWAKDVIEELDAGVSLPRLDFEPHGRSGSISDRTAVEAIRRISRRKFADEKMKGALSTLNEFKAIIRRADINETAQAALWARWGAKMTYKDIGEKLDMPSHQAMSLVHEAESIVQPLIEAL